MGAPECPVEGHTDAFSLTKSRTPRGVSASASKNGFRLSEAIRVNSSLAVCMRCSAACAAWVKMLILLEDDNMSDALLGVPLAVSPSVSLVGRSRGVVGSLPTFAVFLPSEVADAVTLSAVVAPPSTIAELLG